MNFALHTTADYYIMQSLRGKIYNIYWKKAQRPRLYGLLSRHGLVSLAIKQQHKGVGGNTDLGHANTNWMNFITCVIELFLLAGKVTAFLTISTVVRTPSQLQHTFLKAQYHHRSLKCWCDCKAECKQQPFMGFALRDLGVLLTTSYLSQI